MLRLPGVVRRSRCYRQLRHGVVTGCRGFFKCVNRLAANGRQHPDSMLQAECTSPRALALARAGHVGTVNCAVVPSLFDVAASIAALISVAASLE
jgi:hypothetical protein